MYETPRYRRHWFYFLFNRLQKMKRFKNQRVHIFNVQMCNRAIWVIILITIVLVSSKSSKDSIIDLPTLKQFVKNYEKAFSD